MAGLGKVDREFFDEYVYPRLGAARDDVALGPTHGVDFGLLDTDGTAVAITADPPSVLPVLGFERTGRFAINIVPSDIVVSGLDPLHLAVSFTLPPEMTGGQFTELWGAVHDETDDLGVSIVTGHAARYAGCSYPWVGGVTALAVGDHDDVARLDGTKPGDDVLMTKGPGVEATGLLTTLFLDTFSDPDADVLAAAQDRLGETGAVRGAMTVSAVGGRGVHATHDTTEYGVHGALNKVAGSAGVQLEIDESSVPFRPGVCETYEYLGIDPWHSTTAGSPVVATDPSVTDDVVAALDVRDTPVGIADIVVADEGIIVNDKCIEHPDMDPSWAAYERLTREADESGADE